MIDRWLNGAYRASDLDLAVVRVLVASYILVMYVPGAVWLADLPSVYHHPPDWLPAALGGFPDRWEMRFASTGLAVAAAALLVGLWSRPAAVACTLLLLLTEGWRFSTGKIDHNILLVITPLALAWSGWDRRLSLRPSAAALGPPGALVTGRASLCVLALAVALGMLVSALHKVLGGWLSLEDQAAFGHMAKNHLLGGRPTWFSARLVEVESRWFWEAQDWATVGIEAVLLPAALWPRLFKVCLALAACFHLGVLLSFDISFGHNVIVYAAFVPWAGLLGLTRRTGRPVRFGAAGLVFVAALVAACSAALLLDEAPGRQWRFPAECVVVLGPVVGVLAMVWTLLTPRAVREGWTVDPAVAHQTRPVIFFDGVCGLCNAWVDFVMARDPGGLFRFAPLQSAHARDVLVPLGIDPGNLDSIVLVEEEAASQRSTAVLRIVRLLGGPWSLLAVFGAVPRPIRDGVYAWLASHRYRWFGRRESCRLPAPEEMGRFVLDTRPVRTPTAPEPLREPR